METTVVQFPKAIDNAKENEYNKKVIEFFESLNRRESKWLTAKEAACFLSVSPNAIRIMVYRGQIPVYKLGRRLRFKVDDLVALFQKKGA